MLPATTVFIVIIGGLITGFLLRKDFDRAEIKKKRKRELFMENIKRMKDELKMVYDEDGLAPIKAEAKTLRKKYRGVYGRSYHLGLLWAEINTKQSSLNLLKQIHMSKKESVLQDFPLIEN